MVLVSAIITTCKRPAYIVERAIKSVLSQTYNNIECIVIDDSPSTYEERGNVANLAKMYDIRYIPLEKNQGACIARNRGIKESRGEYVAFLDDDDEWLPQKIEKQLDIFSKDVGLVYCGRKTIYDVEQMEVIQHVKFLKGHIFDELILDNFIGSTSFPLIRKSCLLDIGGFDEKQKAAQDYDVWLRIALYMKVNYVKDVLAIYHVHELGQITSNYSNKVSGLERLNNKYKEYLKSNSWAFYIRTIKMAPMYAGNKQYRKAFLSYGKAFLKKPYMIRQNFIYLARLLRIGIHK